MSILDERALENLRAIAGEDAAFLAELVDTFLDDAPRMLADMYQALENEDAVLLRRSAHSLKSNSAGFGALVLSDLCQELETMSRDGASEGAAEKVQQIETEYAQIKPALEAAARE